MPSIRGTKIKLSLPRRWIADLMAVSEGIPFVVGEQKMRLAKLEAARKAVRNGPTLTAIFTKVCAIVARRYPQLRQSYISFPRPHFFESNTNLASISVMRKYQGEPAVFFGQIKDAEEKSLAEIAKVLTGWRSAPIESVGSFSRLVRYSKYPFFVRRILWKLAMNLSGVHRVKRFGTYGITPIGSSRARSVIFRAPTPFNIGFNAVDDDGTCTVLSSMDHRVIDGMTAVRVGIDMENVLNNEIVAELRALAEAQQAISAAA
jgi:pyruvate/2-oxoglutarate dehydrogenase complex dihydrolipoamide acyltransferase (E2) component